ncbi:hypothetical protein D3C81_2299790 [compost metagenome]
MLAQGIASLVLRWRGRLTGTLKAKGEQAMDAMKETVREAGANDVPDASEK